MASTLAVYGTGEGQTGAVVERLADWLAERGHEVTVVDLAAVEDGDRDGDGNRENAPDVAAFDAVLVASPVRNRAHLPAVVSFAAANREALAARPTGFVRVPMASALPWRWARPGAADYVDDLVERTGWRPDRVALVAGAVRYGSYDPLTRLAFRLVAAVSTGDTDASRDYEYTDWADVERFTAAFAAYVDGYLDGQSRGTGERRATDVAPAAAPGTAGRSLAALGLFAGALAVLLWLVVRGRHRGW